ncbi:hypothetical protein BH09ACT4_BH09ACT4_10870 [soil metagenome]
MKRRTSILLTAGFVAAAVGLSVLLPTEEFQQAPYVGTIPALDTQVDAREFSLTVTSVRLADRVVTPEWTGTTAGVWVVVDIEFQSRIDNAAITGSFRIGDTNYLLSSRPGSAAIDHGAFSQPGLPWAGSMLFEIPESALEAPRANSAVVRFAMSSDPRLDGVLDYTIDLTSLDRETSITLAEPQRVAS